MTETSSPMTVGAGGEEGRAVLQVEQLCTWFPTSRGLLHAVDDMSFSLERGTTVGIVGESGSGKSILARSVLGLTPRHAITSGTVRLAGRDIHALSREARREIWGSELSMVFQDPSAALNPVMRVGQQIIEPLRLHRGLSKKDAWSRSVELLRQVGIPEPELRMRSYPHELSGGTRQRAWIAIAIACEPKVLFADEPTTALDVTIQRQVLDLLSELQRASGMAMVLITHDIRVVTRRTDNVMVMYAGQVVESGPTRSVFAAPRHPYTEALVRSTPRLQDKSRTRLTTIPGQPIEVLDPLPACRFAPRCRYARPRCLVEDPPLTNGHAGEVRCFYPVGSDAGATALKENVEAGYTAAGVPATEQP